MKNKLNIPISYACNIMESCIEIYYDRHFISNIKYYTRYINNNPFGIAIDKNEK